MNSGQSRLKALKINKRSTRHRSRRGLADSNVGPIRSQWNQIKEVPKVYTRMDRASAIGGGCQMRRWRTLERIVRIAAALDDIEDPARLCRSPLRRDGRR